ncbi:MAG: DUF4468 domain-containing protein [Bacteroidaceae bacterium]|nr:DUF4468 domain-containing protein [Bacteroidaceae bacterium]
MKKLLAIILLSSPLILNAQESLSSLSGSDRNAKIEKTIDARYLEGAVPVVDGRVKFATTCTSAYADDVTYAKAIEWAKSLAKECITSNITYTDEANHTFVLRNEQYLVFSNRTLALDRTRIYYQITVKINRGKCDVDMSRIKYWYDEQRDGGIHYTAEEGITDENALTKKKNGLLKVCGKFRTRTIDLKDTLFDLFSKAIK